jgi:hypothetical protein
MTQQADFFYREARELKGRIREDSIRKFKLFEVFYESILQVHGFYSAKEFFLKIGAPAAFFGRGKIRNVFTSDRSVSTKPIFRDEDC